MTEPSVKTLALVHDEVRAIVYDCEYCDHIKPEFMTDITITIKV